MTLDFYKACFKRKVAVESVVIYLMSYNSVLGLIRTSGFTTNSLYK